MQPGPAPLCPRPPSLIRSPASCTRAYCRLIRCSAWRRRSRRSRSGPRGRRASSSVLPGTLRVLQGVLLGAVWFFRIPSGTRRAEHGCPSSSAQGVPRTDCATYVAAPKPSGCSGANYRRSSRLPSAAVSHCSRRTIPAQMWAGPGADVGRSRRRCGPAQCPSRNTPVVSAARWFKPVLTVRVLQGTQRYSRVLQGTL